MERETGRRMSLPPELDAIYATIRGELEQTEDMLYGVLCSEHPFVDQLVRHGFRMGGKRLRPALVLLSGVACGSLTETHRTLAAAVEVIHTATLVHDDILDEATTRRHMETINSRWSTEAGVLVGDFLLAQALCLAAETDDPFAVREIAAGCKVMCEGELRQTASRGDFGLTEEEYFKIIEGKTASLLRVCCRLGAHYAGGTPEQIDALGEFGRKIGLAFQIVDDLLDLLGDESRVGKSLGTDLKKRKLTLPMIRMLECSSSKRRQELLAAWEEEEPAADENLSNGDLTASLKNSDALAYAEEAAKREIKEAVELLRAILPDSESRTSLEGLAHFVVKRSM
jgi:octaprenyl-diphosphate synthase